MPDSTWPEPSPHPAEPSTIFDHGLDTFGEVVDRRSVADGLAFPAIEFAHGYIDPIPAESVRGLKGAFGPEVDVPADASATDAFIAWTGRDPR